MRRLILSALVLLPVLASAQTSTSTAAQSTAAAPSLQAKLTPPAGLPAAKPSAAPTGDASSVMVPIHEVVVDSDLDPESGLLASPVVIDHPSTPAVVVKTAPLAFSLQDMRSEAPVSTVTVRVTVGADGLPKDMAIIHSGGSALDQRALAAIGQYRFKPATRNYAAVESAVSISIKLTKS